MNRLLAGLDGVESAAPALALDSAGGGGPRQPGVAGPGRAGRRTRPRPWPAATRPPASPLAAGGFLDRYGHRGSLGRRAAGARLARRSGARAAALHAGARCTRPAGFSRRAAAEQRQARGAGDPLDRSAPPARAPRPCPGRGARRRARPGTNEVAGGRPGRRGPRLARLAGARLAAEGRLAVADDVFFLARPSCARCWRAPRRPRPRCGGAASASRRRRTCPRPRGSTCARARSWRRPSRVWQGTGVSAGIGVGRARVIAAGEPVTLEPGEVLVTTVLDAALGPLLASAAGAVAEIGGLLSHGAVVARELGVPCVVDIHDATRRLRTGERVLVDGSAGTVRRSTTRAARPRSSPWPSTCCRRSPADEAFHALEAHPQARESVYVNVQDPATGIVPRRVGGSAPGGRGRSLVAVGLPDGRVLFALERGGRAGHGHERDRGRHRSGMGPRAAALRGPPLLARGGGLPPRPRAAAPGAARPPSCGSTCVFAPTTPAVDFTHGLTATERARLSPLGAHHVEQSGRWRGGIEIDGERWPLRRHGQPRPLLGPARLGCRGLVAPVHGPLRRRPRRARPRRQRRGRVVEGGFLWREGTGPCARGLDGARHAGALRSVRSSWVTPRGAPAHRGGGRTYGHRARAARTRGIGRHLAGRPWRLLLHENFTRYEGRRAGTGFTDRRSARGVDAPLPAAVHEFLVAPVAFALAFLHARARAGRAPGRRRAAHPGRLRLRPRADLDEPCSPRTATGRRGSSRRGGVPVAVAVVWAAVISAALALAARRGRGRPAARALAAALFAVALDLTMEPVAVRRGLWEWTPPGPWLGVPIGNFVGWVVIVAGYGSARSAGRAGAARGGGAAARRLLLAAVALAALVTVGTAVDAARNGGSARPSRGLDRLGPRAHDARRPPCLRGRGRSRGPRHAGRPAGSDARPRTRPRVRRWPWARGPRASRSRRRHLGDAMIDLRRLGTASLEDARDGEDARTVSARAADPSRCGA